MPSPSGMAVDGDWLEKGALKAIPRTGAPNSVLPCVLTPQFFKVLRTTLAVGLQCFNLLRR
jgi:hypothetical protein